MSSSVTTVILQRHCPKTTPRSFLEVICWQYREQKDPNAALEKDLEQAKTNGISVMDIWEKRVWSFTSRITGRQHFFNVGTNTDDFEMMRESIEDAEAEELQETRDAYDDDDRYCPFGGRRYEPDDLYQ